MMARAIAISGLTVMGLGGCATERPTAPHEVLDTLRIGEDLINVLVQVDGDLAEETASQYAECVAAQYVLDRGYQFARHIRTNRSKTGGNWRADAVYSVSQALPRGSKTLDAEVVVQNCAELGIPTG